MAPATQAKYKACFNRFAAVTQAGGCWGPPGDKGASLRTMGKGQWEIARMVSRHVAAIAHLSKLRGEGDPTAGFPLRAALKGWARQEERTPDQRAPIDINMLRELVGALTTICISQYEELLFGVTFSLAFLEAFRTSELVAGSRSDTSNRALNLGDLKMGPDMAELKVRRSKVDQRGKGAVVRLRVLGDARCCLIELLRRLRMMLFECKLVIGFPFCVMGNASDYNEFTSTISKKDDIIMGTVYSLFGLLSMCGNSVLLLIAYRKRSMLKPAEFFIVNLSVSDMGMTVTLFPLAIPSLFAHRWLFDRLVCKYYAFCGVLFGLCSLTTLTVLSSVCCLKVCYPGYDARDAQRKKDIKVFAVS
ncbi:hypothetical protein NDU88_001604 [Pleurodeles waltl]|uniref:G-protein coupled receptors family 1 profile domain-containing protein n=1 Tax=Pleurodeles waltl TaxID=8319 RepID=A0AAV7P6B2_PLEWA|nr:hypothetical protein NDU88_001604 [Pleurodeles waltl]